MIILLDLLYLLLYSVLSHRSSSSLLNVLLFKDYTKFTCVQPMKFISRVLLPIFIGYIQYAEGTSFDKRPCEMAACVSIFIGFVVPFSCLFYMGIICGKKSFKERSYDPVHGNVKKKHSSAFYCACAVVLSSLVCAAVFGIGMWYLCRTVIDNGIIDKTENVAISIYSVSVRTIKVVSSGLTRSVSIFKAMIEKHLR